MPDFNIYAFSSLLGFLSTGLGVFLTIPSLMFGWRDEIAYLSLATNWIWSLAEACSLAGLLLVPEPLIFSLVLVIWYLISDLLFVIEAIIVKGYLKAASYSPSRFAQRRLRDWWTAKERAEWVLEKKERPHRRPTKLQLALTREENQYEKVYVGARWRRDIEIQVSMLFVGLLGTICIWWFAIFKTGRASEEYKWSASIVSEFNRAEKSGWYLGWVSSGLYIAGRLQADWHVRNAAIHLWNNTVLKNDRDNWVSLRPQPGPLDTPFGVAAILIVVFSVFIFDNLLQILGMTIILIGQDAKTRSDYAYFQSPWLVGSVLAIGVDIKMIWNYSISMKTQTGSDAKRFGKWRYAPGQFPLKQLDPTVSAAFDKIWDHKEHREALLKQHADSRQRTVTRQQRRDHEARIGAATDEYETYRHGNLLYRDMDSDALRHQEKRHLDKVTGRRRAAAAARIGLLKKHMYQPGDTTPARGQDGPPPARPHSMAMPASGVAPPDVPPARRNSMSLGHDEHSRHRSTSAFLTDSEASDLSDTGSSDSERDEKKRSSRFALGRRGRRRSSEENLLV